MTLAGELEPLDAAVFADTQDEPDSRVQSVYRSVDLRTEVDRGQTEMFADEPEPDGCNVLCVSDEDRDDDEVA